MPPFDEDGNMIDSAGQLYIETNDGTYTPFGGIQPVNEISDCPGYGAEYFQTDQVELHFKMTHKTERIFKKLIHRSMNCMKRVRRTLARQKEKLRRESLKKGVKQHE